MSNPVLISTKEAIQILQVSPPTFKKYCELAKPTKHKQEGQKGHFYDRKEILFLEVAYLRALADQKAKKIVEFQEV